MRPRKLISIIASVVIVTLTLIFAFPFLFWLEFFSGIPEPLVDFWLLMIDIILNFGYIIVMGLALVIGSIVALIIALTRRSYRAKDKPSKKAEQPSDRGAEIQSPEETSETA